MDEKKIIIILAIALGLTVGFIVLTNFWDYAYQEGFKAGANAVVEKLKAMQ